MFATLDQNLWIYRFWGIFPYVDLHEYVLYIEISKTHIL